jgi:hypothetical protein
MAQKRFLGALTVLLVLLDLAGAQLQAQSTSLVFPMEQHDSWQSAKINTHHGANPTYTDQSSAQPCAYPFGMHAGTDFRIPAADRFGGVDGGFALPRGTAIRAPTSSRVLHMNPAVLASSGTVSVSEGSQTVTGANTFWRSVRGRIEPGYVALVIRHPDRFESYTIQSIDSDTSLTLDRPVVASSRSGLAYQIVDAMAAFFILAGDDGYNYVLAHVDCPGCRPGASFAQGTRLGHTLALRTGAHLHFGVIAQRRDSMSGNTRRTLLQPGTTANLINDFTPPRHAYVPVVAGLTHAAQRLGAMGFVDPATLYGAVSPSCGMAPSGSYSITLPSYVLPGDAGTVDITVTRTDTSRAETLFLSTLQGTSNGFATNDQNYQGILNQRLDFAAGVATATAQLQVLAATLGEIRRFGIIVQRSPDHPADNYIAKQEFEVVAIGSAATEEDDFGPGVATVIDVSGSMNDTVTIVDHETVAKRRTKLDIAKDATLSLAVIAGQANALTSLATFSQSGSAVVPLGSGSEHLDRFEAAVTGLRAGGGTNIGAGLEAGFGQLASAGSRCAILMSDGQNNVGSFDGVVRRFSSEGIPIYTVGFGEEAGRAELFGIARETGGTFWQAGGRDLGSVFLGYGNLCANSSTTKRVTETMGPGSEVEYTTLVQQGLNEIGGHATWQGSILDVMLVDPRGRQIPSSALSAHEGRASTGSNYLVFSKRNPEPGTWRLKFFWSDPPTVPEQVNIAFSEQSDVVMSLVGIENEYAVGAPVQIVLRTGEVLGQERVPLQEPRMRVRVQKPGSQVVDVIRARSRNLQLLERVVDAATVTLEVHDDGQHEDYHPGDGIFGGVFTDTHEPGVYLIKAEVRGRKSDGTWVQREITATFQVGPLADNPVTAAEVLAVVDLLSQRQDPLRAIEAVRSGQIRTAPAPVTRPATVPQGIPQIRPAQPPVQGEPILQTQPRPSAGGPAAAIERLRARE